MEWSGFKGRARKIEDKDLPRIGAMIGVGEDKIHAVLDVESAGHGFDAKGRPKMLFEPHIFYRQLSGEKRKKAVTLGLAYSKWKPGNYPSDSYPRLARAMEIDETAALKSASWGLGQVMGFNHLSAGYTSVQTFVLAMMDDEDNHLEAMVAFIKSNHLDDNLRAGDWAGFALGYNGAAYASHGYHTKLASRWHYWQKIPDTPWDPDETEEVWEAEDAPAFDDGPAPSIVTPEPPDAGPPVEVEEPIVVSSAPESWWTRLWRRLWA